MPSSTALRTPRFARTTIANSPTKMVTTVKTIDEYPDPMACCAARGVSAPKKSRKT